MNNKSKIQKLTNKLVLFAEEFKCFGFTVAITSLLWPFIAKLPLSIVEKVMKRKHYLVNKYLITKYGYVIDKYRKEQNSTSYKINAPIWVCWLQGEEQMPVIPQICLERIYQHAGSHPIFFLSLSNFQDFVQLPERIMKKYKEGGINHANFSDIVRTALLAEWGGCWIDPTVFVNENLSEEIFLLPFYSIKLAPEKLYITNNLWCNFFLAGQKGCLLYLFVRDMFYEYMKGEERFIDYFMMDYIIMLGYQYIPNVKKLIDDVPDNNGNALLLLPLLLEKKDVSFKKTLLPTYLFKLSWKVQFDSKILDDLKKIIN